MSDGVAPVVDFSWRQRQSANVVIADVRWYLDGRSGLEAYDRGHIPGAIFVDLDRWLSGAPSESRGRHPLPEPEVFAQGMASLGIADSDTVLAYDDAGGVIAARLVWMLRATNHTAALLDGGIQAFEGALETSANRRPAANFAPRPWPVSRLAAIDDVANRTHFVIDARTRERYRGDDDPVDVRSGHIPGARSVPCRENLAPDGTFLALDALRQNFLDAGVDDATKVISYCGSGVTACHNLLAMELVGLGQGRLYPGSWSQYGYANDRPVAVGDQPG